jgi:[protein-PII] uridylyltransferase
LRLDKYFVCRLNDPMSDDAKSLRAFLDAGTQAIRTAHLNGVSGFATCSALTKLMDDAIRSTFDDSHGEKDDLAVAVVAIGGYGRGELFPRSDVDVMVLCSSGAEQDAARQRAKAFLHRLWDVGVNVGHSVRTVDEAIDLYGSALDAWTSMLEGRYLCGNAGLVDRLFQAMKDRMGRRKEHWFVDTVFADVRSRHNRYGSSVKLLEPNIKKSSGGLRDIHTLFWLYRAADPEFFFPLVAGHPACETFLRILHDKNHLDDEQYRATADALEFLVRARHEMHFQSTSQDDTLAYAMQRHVAEALGVGEQGGLRPVEVFMREYYRHARTIHQVHRLLGQKFREIAEPSRGRKTRGLTAYGRLLMDEERLSIDDSVRQMTDAQETFEAFALAGEHGVELDFRLSGAIERSLDQITADVCSSPALAARFRRILRSRNVGTVLHTMNTLGVLGRYIPEFGELVAFFQHNVYHYYTADEHTLIAIENAEGLREQQGALREVFRMLPRKDLLYMAILLHDIAKPRGVANHEITGVDVARTVLHRLGMDEFFPDVAFLVRNHLVMEQTAFRRNIHDAETLKEFAARFEHPAQLDYLFVLTYADLSAVNVTVWTEWKSTVLQELYHRTAEVLRRNLRGADIDRYHRDLHVTKVEEITRTLSEEFPAEEVSRHIESIPNESYMAVFTPDDIAQHLRAGRSVDTVNVLFNHAGAYTEVTVIARDAPFALSRFCAVLSANDANIFDANIFTRNDGLIIDRFRVSAATSGRQLEHRACTKIATDLDRMQRGEVAVEQLFLEHHRKWKRRRQTGTNPSIKIDVQFEDTPRHTIIDVFAPDSVGFLYRVTEAISSLGLDIFFAKIATRVDGIVDAFYVLERSGVPLTDPNRRELTRTSLLDAITKMGALVSDE